MNYFVLSYFIISHFTSLFFVNDSSPLQTTVDADKLYRGNIERVDGLHSYSLGQVYFYLYNNVASVCVFIGC